MTKTRKRIISILLTLIITLSASLTIMITPEAATQEETTGPTEPGITDTPVDLQVGDVTGLKVTKTSTNYISLKWNKVKGATGYTILYRNPAKTKTY